MRKLFHIAISIYQVVIPSLKALFGVNMQCHFSPTCSEYTRQAILQHGVIRGVTLGVKRIWRCRPFVPGGVDPVPERTNAHTSIRI